MQFFLTLVHMLVGQLLRKITCPFVIVYLRMKKNLIALRIEIDFSLESFCLLLRNSKVKWYTDNQSTAKIVEVGSMNLFLHTLAIKIFEFCARFNIELSIEWIPRTMNQKADVISKMVDTDDWQLLPEFFSTLESIWGPYSVDCFATYYNNKVSKFFSRFWNPGSSGIDAFFSLGRTKIVCSFLPLIAFQRH